MGMIGFLVFIVVFVVLLVGEIMKQDETIRAQREELEEAWAELKRKNNEIHDLRAELEAYTGRTSK